MGGIVSQPQERDPDVRAGEHFILKHLANIRTQIRPARSGQRDDRQQHISESATQPVHP